MSEDLREFEEIQPVVTYVCFDDAEGNSFIGWLEIDEKDFIRAKERKDCPKNKSSMEYYYFLREQADAMPCSPDAATQPLTKRDPDGNILAQYIYAVNAQGIFDDGHRGNEHELKSLEKHSRTYFMTAFLWRMHTEAQIKKLPAPKA